MTFDDLGFPTAYSVRVLDQPVGASPFYFSVARLSIVSDKGLTVEVTPHGADPWIGVFAGLGRRHPSGLYGFPVPDRLCVVSEGAGYVVPVHRPTAWESVATQPVSAVRRVPTQPLLIVAGMQELVAYGLTGVQWRVERLSREEISLAEVTATSITGTAMTAEHGAVPFTVDVETGAVQGGWERAGTVRPRPPSGVSR